MPPSKTFKCGVCSLAIGKTQGSLQCRICKKWLHASCANVSDKELKVFGDAKSMAFICPSCDDNLGDNDDVGEDMRALNRKLDCFINKHQSDQSELNKKLDDFIKKNEEDKLALRSAFLDAVADIKSDMNSCLTNMKKDIIGCSKLINHIDTSTTSKISALEMENNVLHRRLNRGDIVVSGLPEGLTDLVSPVIALGATYNVAVNVGDVSHVCYMNHRKLLLVKFNNVMARDKIMREYFKTRSLKISNLISDAQFGGDLESRVYLNDHYSPAASNFNGLCRKLLRSKCISRFKIINSDKLSAKLTLPDGKEVVYDAAECAGLLNAAV